MPPVPARQPLRSEVLRGVQLAEKILTSRSAREGELKQVTALFADLKGSMELLADRDPEEARKLLDPVLERMMESVHRYGGTVNQVMGNGIMALLDVPVDDAAWRSLDPAQRRRLTLGAVTRLRALDPSNPWGYITGNRPGGPTSSEALNSQDAKVAKQLFFAPLARVARGAAPPVTHDAFDGQLRGSESAKGGRSRGAGRSGRRRRSRSLGVLGALAV